MCGRTRCTLGEDQVLQTAGAKRWEGRERYQPSYNASPGFPAPVVRREGEEPVVYTMRWGLVPSYTKPDDKPDFWRMFNARSESVAEKPAFRRLVPSRRCLVLADGFYEWKKEKGGKQPYYIHLSTGEPLVMAGLWDVWESAEGPMHTYTILTTDSCPRLQWLHDRMPVILRDKEAQQAWLNTEDKEALGTLHKLYVPYDGEDLVWFPVTPKMNTPAFQGPECCKELKKPSMQSFFKPRSAKSPGAAPAEGLVAAEGAQKGGAAEVSEGEKATEKEHERWGERQQKEVQQAGAEVKVEVKQEDEPGSAEVPAGELEGPAAGGSVCASNKDVWTKQEEKVVLAGPPASHDEQAAAAGAGAGPEQEPSTDMKVKQEQQATDRGQKKQQQDLKAGPAAEQPIGPQGGAAGAVNADEQPAERQAAEEAAAVGEEASQAQQGAQEGAESAGEEQPGGGRTRGQQAATPRKRKQPGSGGGGGGKGPSGDKGGKGGSTGGSASKKAKLPGQMDITKFLKK